MFPEDLKGLLSQKEYLVYFTNICSAATVTESSFLGIPTEFTGTWHFPGLFKIMCRVFGYIFSGYSTVSQPRLQQLNIGMKQKNT